MILDDFPYLTVTATCGGEPTGCCYGFNTGELTYGETFQPRVYTGSDEEHVSRSYVSANVKDGCYRTVTLEAVERSAELGERHGVFLEGLYLSEGRSQGFDSGEGAGTTPALSVGRFFYVGNVGNVSETVMDGNNLVLSASAADYTITVTLTRESVGSGTQQKTEESGAEEDATQLAEVRSGSEGRHLDEEQENLIDGTEMTHETQSDVTTVEGVEGGDVPSQDLPAVDLEEGSRSLVEASGPATDQESEPVGAGA